MFGLAGISTWPSGRAVTYTPSLQFAKPQLSCWLRFSVITDNFQLRLTRAVERQVPISRLPDMRFKFLIRVSPARVPVIETLAQIAQAVLHESPRFKNRYAGPGPISRARSKPTSAIHP